MNLSLPAQKVTGKKQKKDKTDKKDNEGPPAKKPRASTGAKAVAAAAAAAASAAANGQSFGSNGLSMSIDSSAMTGTENNTAAFPYAGYPQQNAGQHHETAPVASSGPGSHAAPQPAKPKSNFPLDPVSCALYNFSGEDVNAHFKHIHEGMKITAGRIREICMPIIEQIFAVPHAYNIFGWPVDPIQLGIPDYNDVVKVPMDLGTVKRRLETGHYRDLVNFVQDVHLCFDNAMLYNPRNSDVHTLAKSLKREFDNHYKLAITHSEKAIEMNRTNESACLVCGEIGKSNKLIPQ
jgi:hypothetical protein